VSDPAIQNTDSPLEPPTLDVARVAVQRGLYGKAVKILERFVAGNPSRAERLEALLTLGTVLEDRSEGTAAVRWLSAGIKELEATPDLISTVPTSLLKRAYVDLGYLLVEAEEFAEAERILRACLALPSLDPSTSSIALRNLAHVLSKSNRYEEAIAVGMDTVRATEASGFAAYLAREELASSLLAVDRLNEAQEVIVQAIRSIPPPPPSEMARFFRVAAQIANKRGDGDLVRDYVREGEHFLQFDNTEEDRELTALELAELALDHREMDVLLRLGHILSKSKTPGNRSDGVYFAASALYGLGRNEECLAQCRTMLSDPTTDVRVVGALRKLAICAAGHVGKWDEARDQFILGEREGFSLKEFPQLEAYLKSSTETARKRKRWFLG